MPCVWSIVDQAKREWRLVIGDRPGYRFVNQFRRSQRDRSLTRRAARLGVGLAAVAVGIVMLFTPGPGWLMVFFGLGMFASESYALSRFLDRAEVIGRAWGRRVRQRWRSASLATKAVAAIALLSVVGLGSAAMWKVWT